MKMVVALNARIKKQQVSPYHIVFNSVNSSINNKKMLRFTIGEDKHPWLTHMLIEQSNRMLGNKKIYNRIELLEILIKQFIQCENSNNYNISIQIINDDSKIIYKRFFQISMFKYVNIGTIINNAQNYMCNDFIIN